MDIIGSNMKFLLFFPFSPYLPVRANMRVSQGAGLEDLLTSIANTLPITTTSSFPFPTRRYLGLITDIPIRPVATFLNHVKLRMLLSIHSRTSVPLIWDLASLSYLTYQTSVQSRRCIDDNPFYHSTILLETYRERRYRPP